MRVLLDGSFKLNRANTRDLIQRMIYHYDSMFVYVTKKLSRIEEWKLFISQIEIQKFHFACSKLLEFLSRYFSKYMDFIGTYIRYV